MKSKNAAQTTILEKAKKRFSTYSRNAWHLYTNNILSKVLSLLIGVWQNKG